MINHERTRIAKDKSNQHELQNLRLQLTFQDAKTVICAQVRCPFVSALTSSSFRTTELQLNYMQSFPIFKTYFQILPNKTIVRLFNTN